MQGHVRMDISKQLRTADEAFAKITAIPELAHRPVVIGENDPEGCAACPGARNAYRNDTMYSSYTAAVYARLWQLAQRRNVNLEGALTWAFTFVGQPWFAGFRQLSTNGVDLPVLNVFRLFARLETDQVEATSSAQTPLPLILSDGVRAAPDVGVIATRAQAGGRLDILLWHYRDDDVLGPSAEVRVLVSGIAPTKLQARIWRVDRQNSDAFTEWQAMGAPAKPTRQQILRLRNASGMVAHRMALSARTDDGSIELEIRLPLQGVALIELRQR
jgi:xylan 1,4-beta-xylosidase